MNKLILYYVKSGIEPLPDPVYGDGYRCSVYLTDGTHLPCVILRESSLIVTLAIRRFEHEKTGKEILRLDNAYNTIVKHFVTSGNRVNHYDIAKLETSRYAIPLNLLKQIHGETTMSWTGFVLEMRNGKLVAFGTPFNVEFFDIPNEYSFDDVVAVHNHSYVSPNGDLRSLIQGAAPQPAEHDRSLVCRERPYFECFYDV
jgi:hypothetical protein